MIAIWLVARWTGALQLLGYGRRGDRLGRPERRRARPGERGESRRRPERMADLTHQEISDAEFEEIPKAE